MDRSDTKVEAYADINKHCKVRMAQTNCQRQRNSFRRPEHHFINSIGYINIYDFTVQIEKKDMVHHMT